MKMEYMILACLVLLLITEVIGLVHNGITLNRNVKTAYKEADDLRELNLRFKQEKLAAVEAYQRLAGKQIDGSAILIAGDGIKMLPKGWEDAFATVWAPK